MRLNDQVIEIFLEETAERLDSIESGLLHLETCGLDCGTETINSIFRDAHSVKAGSNLLKLTNIEDLAHKLENVLEMIRQKKIAPSEMIVTACLESVDKLRELIENVDRSETISTRLHKHMLDVAVQKTLNGE
ncbi:Hpt domain-containing protein [Pseudodesulfovibrio thermohalotolerans]|uniref:Hpt domain-containing protein n=1 Tax=Pseudodesulfovibrio thermohalotolerans TaxID=2880651 RepID=UPI00244192D4|nr:Hpt domain-containing protein [Pseudodesulfovibrio thermohalotolerans]WFS61329.1 Hpt domain-containing protein [Pseudodesulfovibrio thermohalotolerans]